MNIKELIEKSGMTQEEVAEKVGVSTASVWNWANGNSEPADENKEKLMKVLGAGGNGLVTRNRRSATTKAASGANRKLHGLSVTLYQTGPHLIGVTQDRRAFVLS